MVIAAGQVFLPEGSMRRHDWIFDVLSDLQDYALANGLPDLAMSVEMTLAVARQEAGVVEGPPNLHPARPSRTH